MRPATHRWMSKTIVDKGNGISRVDTVRVAIANIENYQRKGYALLEGDAGHNAHEHQETP
jgi:hypothetical protein